MNIQKARKLIELYKRDFATIHGEEIYKWRAIKCFQDNWNLEAKDFPAMLKEAFAASANLLSGADYYPVRMLQVVAEHDPETLRTIFAALFNEEDGLEQRVQAFQDGFMRLRDLYFPGKNDYQDQRAVMVYLCFRYPDRYYLYKFGMFKDFAPLVDYPYTPVRGHFANVQEYLTLAGVLRDEISRDSKLIELHRGRISPTEYFDTSLNILTQDVIYAATTHFASTSFPANSETKPRLKKVSGKLRAGVVVRTTLQGRFTNWLENEKSLKTIGDRGELLVLDYEINRVKELGIAKPVIHAAVIEGDGLGYDILSYDEKGDEIYIEVKTTSGGCGSPIFITDSELIRSQKDPKHFRLYRVFDFDEERNEAKFIEREGSLDDLCSYPVLYRANLDLH